MEPAAVRALYDRAYARDYENRWVNESSPWAPETRSYLNVIRSLVQDDARWLDVGCGTGYFLSQFPGVTRGGLDLSPDMLDQARTANPDALFLREADIRDDVPEWHDAWDVVTCTGQPWCYLRTVDEIERFVENLARWTSPSGVCFLGVTSITEVIGASLPYRCFDETTSPGHLVIEAVVWSLYEDEAAHEHMLYPNLGHWVELFSRSFGRVEVVPFAEDQPNLAAGRKSIVAREKRAPGNADPAVVVEDTSTVAPTDEKDIEPPTANGEERPGGRAMAETAPEGPASPVPLRDRTVGDLMSRVRPLSPTFWRAVDRRVRRPRS